MDDLFCWRWARRSTWRSVRVSAHAGAWAAEAWEHDLKERRDRTVATHDGKTPTEALQELSNVLYIREQARP